jgi:hypothetical protein
MERRPKRLTEGQREVPDMTRSIAVAACVAIVISGCGGGPATTSAPPGNAAGATSSVAPSRAPASAPASAAASASAEPANLPRGLILFHRAGSDGVERYFTIHTDGTGERALFTQEGCSCAQWSRDGTRIWTLDATGQGNYWFTTMRPDGSDRVVLRPTIKTLNLAPGASSADGRRIAFNGWDEQDPSHNGLYLASPDLSDLRRVMPLSKGMIAVEPFGVTPDGAKVLFFGEQGSHGGVTHAGGIFVVGSDGRGLRQLNPSGTWFGEFGLLGSLSPDGRRAAFAAFDDALGSAVFVADVDGGPARRITDWAADESWGAAWSPSGDWIAYSQHHGPTNVVALVRPDGSDPKEISAIDQANQALAPAWSLDGKYLLVQRGWEGRRNLWIMDLSGTYLGQVTDEPSDYGTYSFSPAAGS